MILAGPECQKNNLTDHINCGAKDCEYADC